MWLSVSAVRLICQNITPLLWRSAVAAIRMRTVCLNSWSLRCAVAFCGSAYTDSGSACLPLGEGEARQVKGTILTLRSMRILTLRRITFGAAPLIDVKERKKWKEVRTAFVIILKLSLSISQSCFGFFMRLSGSCTITTILFRSTVTTCTNNRVLKVISCSWSTTPV